MLSRLSILCLLILPSLVMAQESQVRTGWHPSFTRIVVPMPENSNWEVGTIDGGFGIRIPNSGPLDLSLFFQRIPNDRAQSVTVERGDTLVIASDCDCHLDAFEWRPDRLVVDIKDGTGPIDNPFSERIRLEPLQEAKGSILNLLPKPRLPRRVTVSEISPLQNALLPEIMTDGFEDDLIQEIGRAAERGFLTLEDPDEEIISSEIDVEASDPSVNDEPENDLKPHPGIVTFTAGSGRAMSDMLETSNHSCWPNTFVDIPSWGNGMSFSDRLSDARSKMFAEFDEIEPNMVKELVKTYLYFGFGQEAIEAIQSVPEGDAEFSAMAHLAQIIDDPDYRSPELSAQIWCDNRAVLWGFLANDENRKIDRKRAEKLVMMFRELPDDLRAHLSVRIASKLLSHGYGDAAEHIMYGDSSNAEPTFEATVLDASIALERDQAKQAVAMLEDSANNDPRMTPSVLADLIALQLQNSSEIQPQVVELLETMVFEIRGTPEEENLLATQIDVELSQEKYEAALRLIPELAAITSNEGLTSAVSRIFDAVADARSDAAFLTYAFHEKAMIAGPGPQNRIARRLLEQGFPDRAAEILEGSATGDDLAERRYLLAWVAMASDKPELAQTILLGDSSARAARILEGRPDDPSASDDRPDIAPEEVVLEDWRQEDWANLADGSDVTLSRAAELALTTLDPQPVQVAPLKAGEALLVQSEQTRSSLEEILNRFSVPD